MGGEGGRGWEGGVAVVRRPRAGLPIPRSAFSWLPLADNDQRARPIHIEAHIVPIPSFSQLATPQNSTAATPWTMGLLRHLAGPASRSSPSPSPLPLPLLLTAPSLSQPPPRRYASTTTAPPPPSASSSSRRPGSRAHPAFARMEKERLAAAEEAYNKRVNKQEVIDVEEKGQWIVWWECK